MAYKNFEIFFSEESTLHGRFPPMMASRTLPRGPDTKYSDKYYFQRNAFNSVHPPVVAPVAEGPPLIKPKTKPGAPRETMAPNAICFNFAPTPGPAWWWDGHCYYEEVKEPPPPVAPKQDDLCPKPEQKLS